WVDSNGWLVRLEGALHPENSIWVDAPPAAANRVSAASYLVALADSASHDGRLVLTVDSELAGGLSARKPQALETWSRITATAGFFAARQLWTAFVPAAVVGVVSDFTGANDFFSRELLNLLARAGQHYRILLKDRVDETAMRGLRAV